MAAMGNVAPMTHNMRRRQRAGAATRPGDSARAVAAPTAAGSTTWAILATTLDGPTVCIHSIRRILTSMLSRRLGRLASLRPFARPRRGAPTAAATPPSANRGVET